jgi:rhodanese-related sulfurtransferase
MQTISRDELKKKMDQKEDMAIVEVLGPESYEEFHLPGAINVPVGKNFESDIQQAVPDKNREVVVYCADTSCDASPKAAEKMENLGYEHVYDYEAGKQDWKGADLPIES